MVDPSTLPPPPEPSMSRFRQKLRFISDPFLLLAEARKEVGDLFVLHLPGLGGVHFLCSARLLSEVYKMPEEQVVAGEIREKLVGFLTGSKASLSIDGPEYLERRRVMAPHFSGRILLDHAVTIRDFAEEMIARWPRSGTFCLKSDLNEITLKTICRILYGPLEGKLNQNLYGLSDQFLDAFRSPAVHTPFLRWNFGRRGPWGRFLAIREEMYEAIRSATTLDGVTENDGLMAGFMASRPMDDEAREIIAQEVLSLLVGGAETTATVLAWTLVGALSDRRIVLALRRELDEVLGGQPIEATHLRSLPYLDAVIQEGMRYQSVGPFAGPRLAKKDFDLGGYRVAAGSILVQCLSEVGRDPEIFPHPDRFDPDNFFERDVKTRDWVPFGGGSRVCTGMGLAKLEMTVVLATIFQQVDLELGPGSTRPVRKGLTFMPKNDLCVRLRS